MYALGRSDPLDSDPASCSVRYGDVWVSHRPAKPSELSSSFLTSNVADPDLDPICQRYGSGSGSFYHQAKIVRKTLIPNVL